MAAPAIDPANLSVHKTLRARLRRPAQGSAIPEELECCLHDKTCPRALARVPPGKAAPTISLPQEPKPVHSKTDPDVIAGLFFMVVGAVGLYLGWDYAFGTTQRIGPGFMPKLLCWAMIGVGAAVAIMGVMRRESPTLEDWATGPLAAILCAVLVFTALLEQQGLPLSVAALVLVSSTAMPAPNRTEALLLQIGAWATLFWLTVNNLTLKGIVSKSLPAVNWLFEGVPSKVFGVVAIVSIIAALVYRFFNLTVRETLVVLLTTTILAVSSVVVFVEALGLPMRVWPEWLLWN